MQAPITPIVRDLVLLGGGHSHAIALKLLGMNPIPGVRLTLITDVYHTPYSGMLPGYVAGLYDYDECHIDLRPLCQFAQTRMIVDQAIALDPERNQIHCANHPPISFDFLSVDIGSTPASVTVPGAKEYAIPVKPISQFLTYWETLVQEVEQYVLCTDKSTSQSPLHLGIVGGGAGGVELALAIQARLTRIRSAHALDSSVDQIHLFHRGAELLPERHPKLRRLFQKLMGDRDIHLHLNEEVVAITSTSGESNQPEPSTYQVMGRSGAQVECDRVFWVTSAAAAPWIAQSGIATDDRGFIQVNDNLQSVSHPHIFAAGDIATMVNYPRPKAGVFAVRQGQPLHDNLRRAVQNQPLRPFQPQKEFLILVGTGEESAIASRGRFTVGPMKRLWQWKDHIDRQFMQRFTNLTPMKLEGGRRKAEGGGRKAEGGGRRAEGRKQKAEGRRQKAEIQNSLTPSLPHSLTPCAGCASKVSKSVLQQVLTQLQPSSSSILIGLGAADDAAVIQVPPDMALVQTVDYFRALLNDPFLVGQITTQHCLNDLYAMGAIPHSALAIATLPYALPAKLESTLHLLLAGVITELSAVGAELIGGHTVEGPELGLGLSCNGFAHPEKLWRKGGMQPGDQLILTKPLGIGTLFAADMQLRAKGRWIEAAIATMRQSHHAAMNCLRQHGTTACTDITGFGLAGHLLEMVQAANLSVELQLDALPILSGATITLEQGFFSSLHQPNAQASSGLMASADITAHPFYPILFDPQTSGGLLATVPLEQSSACLQQLRQLGYTSSQTIGKVVKNTTSGPSLYCYG
ncbi:MAG: selenide, water dikinase SelD [Cyanothece sp. SIO2G6]|nr:selenide, water dikinase SelD [Cyanothece sp. SIO2G6]